MGMTINDGLTANQRSGIVELLGRLLADEYVLYTQTRNFHWNVTGPHFNDLHKFFEGQYEVLDAKIDELAENIRYFGVKTPATLVEFLQLARLKETPAEYPNASGMVTALLAAHETMIRQLRADITLANDTHGAADVADFLTSLLEDHDKMAWMLRSISE